MSFRAGTLAVCLLPLFLGWFAGCGHVESGAPGLHGQHTALIGVDTGLLQRIPTAPLSVAHEGTRHVEFRYAVEGQPQTLVYDENVRADGKGNFEIDLADVKTPALSPAALEQFELTHKLREGFFFRYRDFRVRELELFLSNYRTSVLPEQPVVAGRTCVLLDVRRVGSSPVRYEVAVDPEHALILRSREYSVQSNALLAQIEFTRLTLEPDFMEPVTSPPSIGAVTLPSEEDNSATLGFQPLKPQVLPAGFQLLSSERFENDGSTWIRRVYGDGLETLFVLQRGPRTDGPASVEPTPSFGPGVGLPTQVRVFQMGPWTVAEVLDRERNLFVLGKVGEEAVLQALQSVR